MPRLSMLLYMDPRIVKLIKNFAPRITIQKM